MAGKLLHGFTLLFQYSAVMTSYIPVIT